MYLYLEESKAQGEGIIFDNELVLKGHFQEPFEDP